MHVISKAISLAMRIVYTRKHKRMWMVGVAIGLLSFAMMIKYVYLYYSTLPRTIGERDPYDLIINAYHRSGSSWFGSLFNLRKDTFYWYEPLWSQPQGSQPLGSWPLHMFYFSREGLMCPNTVQHCSKGDKDGILLEDSLTFLKDIYDCRLVNHRSRFNDAFSDQIHDGLYKQCISKTTQRNAYIRRQRCFGQFIAECPTAKHKVTKLVRLDIHHTVKILQDNPRLKVIQLMRDPRAVINSRINTDWYPLKESHVTATETNAFIQCNRMRSDIRGVKYLEKRFPDRVRIVQYEDIAPHPEAIETVFTWLGMDMPIGNYELDELIRNNKGRRVDTFRDKLRYKTVDIIQTHCADVIEILGLRMFKSDAEMKNRSINAVNGRLTHALS